MAKPLFLVPPPPRSSGNAQTDLPMLVDWLYKLYIGTQSYVQGQGTAADFNPATLPDPGSSNVATAQKTANQAYTLANTAETAATAAQSTATTASSAASAAQATATTANNRTSQWFAGQVTVNGGGTTADHTFSGGESEADTNYRVLATAVSRSGSAAAGCETITKITKATDKFTINVATDPGGSETVTFDFLVVRFA